jgi:hypothetical protein
VRDGRWKKKKIKGKKCADHVREKGETKLVSENFFVKVMRFLGVIF